MAPPQNAQAAEASPADEPAETRTQRTVGMATCAASQFDISSKLPYSVTAPLALVLDRRDVHGQVVGCLQANDVAVAVDVKLPWIMLPKGSFVRFPQMKKARIKLQKEGWMVTHHSDFGALLKPDNVEEVRKLFDQNAFKKPPMVKVAPSEKKEEAEEDTPTTDPGAGGKAPPMQQAPKTPQQPPQLLPSQAPPQPPQPQQHPQQQPQWQQQPPPPPQQKLQLQRQPQRQAPQSIAGAGPAAAPVAGARAAEASDLSRHAVPFNADTAKALLGELIEKYSLPAFVQRCQDLDASWAKAPQTTQEARLLALNQLCDTVIRSIIPRYGFDASPTGCKRARAAVDGMNRKIFPDVQALCKQMRKTLYSHFTHLNAPPDLAAARPAPYIAGPRPPATPPQRPEAAARAGMEVLFWGICDIKYDPGLPAEDRVLVLELGDGRASRFSGHGSYIKESFDSGYFVSDSPLKRSIMVDNKKITHDMFARAGYEHLRPRTAVYPRRYTEDLALRLVRDLGLRDGHAAVLKLLNRSRGAGVVVVTAETADSALRRLLTPPTGVKMQEWLEQRTPSATKACYGFQDPLEEPCLHWWSNECPVFLAERCCHSSLVPAESGSDQLFDGTMRVAFALRQPNESAGASGPPFEVVWLGGYWKLPKVASTESTDRAGSPEDLHDRIVSSFNSAEKRTAPVPKEDLERVYQVLTPALPKIFHIGGLQPEAADRMYKEEPLFRAFALARIAAAIRLSDMSRARALLETARGIVPPPIHFSAEELPERSVLSYVERNFGVSCAIEGKWEEAGVHWRRAVRMCSSNATAYYLEGCYQQVNGNYGHAVRCMRRSIALDPDFRSSYIGLSNCYLLDDEYELAIEACDSCLHRFPDAVGAQFNLGQAVYQILRASSSVLEDAPGRLESAVRHYEAAKSQAPDFWTADDAKVLQWLQSDNGLERARMQRVPVHIWRVFGWRP